MEIESSSPALSYLSLIFVAQTMKSNSILCNINLSIPTIILNKTNRRVRDAVSSSIISITRYIYNYESKYIYWQNLVAVRHRRFEGGGGEDR